MKLSTVLGLTLLGVLTVIQSSTASTCTVTEYDVDDIATAISVCSKIVLNGISVPPGVTLNLNLKPGTRLTFQGTTTWGFYEWSGPLLNITGTDVEIRGVENHILDGRGSLWWDGKGEHGGKVKPLLFVLHGLQNSVVHDLNITNPPYHAIWIEDSDSVTTYDIFVNSSDGDTLGGHNTDGINVWRSNNVTLERTIVYNQDDCIALKSGTNIVVKNTYCFGGHGLSIGSVGGRDYNIVENVLISDSEIVRSDNGIRIKTVYGATGSVTNVTYEDTILNDINNYGIIIEGDYDINTGGPTGNATGGVPIKHFILRNVVGSVKPSGVNIYVLVKNATDWSWTGINVSGGKKADDCEGIPEDSGILC
uniref:endo-polygalacturonase n=1 Tax=Mesosa myops TaxID=993118 RepID=A0A6F7XWI6_9CUCU|nr:endopolygalacturonase [Mesosa myops]